ncbi:phosphotransferase [Limibacillus sp. MBR-115]|jgi:thiamine kinase-like enzyme|uniref:phosphotransferase n=1 Tax=Limibacillus sp. MBR-115 TaxID=3156465 RepID=UPI0033996019
MSDSITRIKGLPIWAGSVDPVLLKGGLSNESYTVIDAGRKQVVRLGRDFPFHHVFRDRELMTTRAAVRAGFAPEVTYAEPGLMVTVFIEGQTYGADEVQTNLEPIADLIRGFHQAMPRHVSGAAFLFWVFHVIRDYARTLEAGGSRMAAKLPEFLDLSEEFEAVQVPLPIIFGHNDLLPANFIEDDKRIWLIDFEYAGFSTAMFDLAGIASNAGFSPEQDEALLARYFDEKPSPALLRSHAAMKCASLLRETLWSSVSELHLSAPGVDYEAYTQENLDRLAAELARYRSRYGKA